MERWTSDEVKNRPEALKPLTDLLFQLADDDLVIGYRDQEWLGLAPHIEEDVAFGSIAQEEIGHAAWYFRMLEELGMGRADDLASLREARERKNAVMLELPNGEGADYLTAPHFDWDWTIVRHYLHDVWEMARLEALKTSRYLPLAEASEKILSEKRYHRAHQELWMRTMARHDSVSRQKLEAATAKAFQWLGDLPSVGPAETALEHLGIFSGVDEAKRAFWDQVDTFFGELRIHRPEAAKPLDGRQGQHTPELARALSTLSEVYRLDPTAKW
ncbi:1,2-phenylacetyl-CoA epoxidase subunit PaaC [Sulfobacillus harzensis]|uniref:Phenylacetate-CoA oxygenase subunit PaaC n=1 Tax=Sulfobacillus harzensis TaxID=2729629 RepID=A0A7Y0L4M7_9FIRM|nr:phenylacetate-CoA oxygenase subunit PaaC [Sulfobacillus harzensis]